MSSGFGNVKVLKGIFDTKKGCFMDKTKFYVPEYKRQHGEGFEVVAPVSGDDISDLLELAVTTARQHGVVRYENSARGLEAFRERTLQYFEYIVQQNEKADAEDTKRLIPSIESWAVFMGCSRMTILTYEKQRSDDWGTFIAWSKNVVQSTRSQLADLGRLPAIPHIFSAVNSNAGYYNTSEIRVKPIEDEQKVLAATESPQAITARYRALLADSTEIDKDTETAESVHI